MVKEVIRENRQRILKEEYNGWSNFDTWAVSAYLNNEEPLYRALQKYKGKLTVQNLKTIFSALPKYNRVGFKEINPKKVNWQEIVDSENNDY